MGMTSGVLNSTAAEPPMPAWMLEARAARGITGGKRDVYGRIPPDVRYAILRSPQEKPTVFPSLNALARRIQRERGDADLQLVNATLFIPGEQSGRAVAKVYTLCEGQQHRFLGYAWLGDVGSPREVLQASLYAVQPRLFEAAA